MDMVREELEHSIDDGESHPGAARLVRQRTMAAAQGTEEVDRDLDDPDFAGRKE